MRARYPRLFLAAGAAAAVVVVVVAAAAVVVVVVAAAVALSGTCETAGAWCDDTTPAVEPVMCTCLRRGDEMCSDAVPLLNRPCASRPPPELPPPVLAPPPPLLLPAP